MGRHRTYVGTLTEEERKRLELVANSRTGEYRRVIRAKAILLSADGLPVKEVAVRTAMGEKTVTALCKKWKAFGAYAALSDLKRPGRPPVIDAGSRTWVTKLACSCPKELKDGPALQTWTISSLRDYVLEHCEAEGHSDLSKSSTSTIWTILKGHDLKPCKIRYYLDRKDPDFNYKAANVLRLYKKVTWMLQLTDGYTYGGKSTPSELTGEVVISYDEKPGIQAIEGVAPDLLPTLLPGQSRAKRDYEYIRHGTVSLLAGIDLMSGEVTAIVRDKHGADEFIEFLQAVDSKYDKGMVIRIILDNHSVHKCRRVMAWLEEKQGRFVFTFTPKHASWLNIIEGLFSKLARTALKHLRVKTKDELRSFLEAWIEDINRHPVVFRWKWGLEDIQGALEGKYEAA